MTHVQAASIVATIDALIASRVGADRCRQRGEYDGYLMRSEQAELARKQLVEQLATALPNVEEPKPEGTIKP